MKRNNGYSIPALLVAVTVLVILGSLAAPLFNSYKQSTEVNEAVSYVLNFQKDIESCVYERQNITDCDLGNYGIQAPPSLSEYNIIAYDVVDGTISMTLDNENLNNDTFPIEIAFFAIPEMRETVPTVSWNVYCNDYDGSGNELYKLCNNHISEMPEELPDDWITWKEFSTPWRTIGGINYTSDWTPEANLQIQDYVQTRGYSYDQERDVIKKIKNLNTGEVVESLRKREERTISDTENRSVDVTVSDWKDLNQTQNCSDWEPPRDEVEKGVEYIQTRDCSIEQEREYLHTVANNQPIHRRDLNQIVQYTEERSVTGTKVVSSEVEIILTSPNLEPNNDGTSICKTEIGTRFKTDESNISNIEVEPLQYKLTGGTWRCGHPTSPKNICNSISSNSYQRAGWNGTRWVGGGSSRVKIVDGDWSTIRTYAGSVGKNIWFPSYEYLHVFVGVWINGSNYLGYLPDELTLNKAIITKYRCKAKID